MPAASDRETARAARRYSWAKFLIVLRLLWGSLSWSIVVFGTGNGGGRDKDGGQGKGGSGI